MPCQPVQPILNNVLESDTQEPHVAAPGEAERHALVQGYIANMIWESFRLFTVALDSCQHKSADALICVSAKQFSATAALRT